MSIVNTVFRFLGYTKISSRTDNIIPVIIYHHQVLVIASDEILELDRPLVNLDFPIDNSDNIPTHLFPMIVGDDGRIVCAKFGRRISYRGDRCKNKVYLEYILDKDKKKTIHLVLDGHAPQTIYISKDTRSDRHKPIVVFLPDKHRMCKY